MDRIVNELGLDVNDVVRAWSAFVEDDDAVVWEF